jgi:hypothetical protein
VTYTPGQGSARDRLRFRLGDIDPTAELYPDAEYDGLLALWPTEDRALYELAKALIVRYAQQPNEVSVSGAVAVKWAERLATWRALVADLGLALGLTSTLGGAATLATIPPQRYGRTDPNAD